jgi:hypothetical protein
VALAIRIIMNLPYCFDEQGNPVSHGDPYLDSLWTNIAKCGLENRVEKSGFEVDKFYRPLQAALSHVDTLLSVVQECRKSDGKVRAVKGDPDFARLSINFDRQLLYRQSAANLRHHASSIKQTIDRLESFLTRIVEPLIAAGFQVDYNQDTSMWVVDFGYKQMFAKFNAHFESVFARDHYAVMEFSEDGDLVYKFPEIWVMRLVHAKDETLCLPYLFHPDEELLDDEKLYEFMVELGRFRQSLIEQDLFEFALKNKLLTETDLKLSPVDNVEHNFNQNYDPLLLSILRQYLQ